MDELVVSKPPVGFCIAACANTVRLGLTPKG